MYRVYHPMYTVGIIIVAIASIRAAYIYLRHGQDPDEMDWPSDTSATDSAPSFTSALRVSTLDARIRSVQLRDTTYTSAMDAAAVAEYMQPHGTYLSRVQEGIVHMFTEPLNIPRLSIGSTWRPIICLGRWSMGNVQVTLQCPMFVLSTCIMSVPLRYYTSLMAAVVRCTTMMPECSSPSVREQGGRVSIYGRLGPHIVDMCNIPDEEIELSTCNVGSRLILSTVTRDVEGHVCKHYRFTLDTSKALKGYVDKISGMGDRVICYTSGGLRAGIMIAPTVSTASNSVLLSSTGAIIYTSSHRHMTLSSRTFFRMLSGFMDTLSYSDINRYFACTATIRPRQPIVYHSTIEVTSRR